MIDDLITPGKTGHLPASKHQLSFIRAICKDMRMDSAYIDAFIRDLDLESTSLDTLTRRDASTVVERLRERHHERELARRRR